MTAISTILGAILYLRFGCCCAYRFYGSHRDYHHWSFGYNSNCNGCCRNSNKQKSSRRWSLLYYFKIFWIKYWCCHWNSFISFSSHFCSLLCHCICKAFMPFSEFLIETYPFLEDYSVYLLDKRLIGIIMMVLFSIIMLTKGANIGMNLLYYVVAILFGSLIMFFMGKPIKGHNLADVDLISSVSNPDSFFMSLQSYSQPLLVLQLD